MMIIIFWEMIIIKYKFIDVPEEYTASFFQVEMSVKRVASNQLLFFLLPTNLVRDPG
jgi:hypothetical protein